MEVPPSLVRMMHDLDGYCCCCGLLLAWLGDEDRTLQTARWLQLASTMSNATHVEQV